jgi:hypothetical protein
MSNIGQSGFLHPLAEGAPGACGGVAAKGRIGMRKSRVSTTIGVAFVVSQILAAVIHGFVLAADYQPYEGTLLRRGAGDPPWQMLFLPVAHLSFISVLGWMAMRLRLDAAPMGRGLVLGLVGWGMGQVPLWLVWYAEQPWPGTLVVKQLGLELVSSIVVGLTIATILRSPSHEAVRSEAHA